MPELTLVDWLEERRQNALRIASRCKTDSNERQNWLEDASYYSRAVFAVEKLMAASGDDHANLPLRTYIALKILRAWNSGTAGFDGNVVVTINDWIDKGRQGPIPWPGGAFFEDWAEKNGLSQVGPYIGFKFTATLKEVAHG